MIIYLYKKTHKITGLKYLGKTKSTDPHKYRGSGKYWVNHIKKYGYLVDTEILKECYTNDELKYWGKYYSNLWNIVDANDWANLKPEEGDGGDTSYTKAYKEKSHLFSHKGKDNPMYGKRWKWTEEQCNNVTGINHSGYGKKWSKERREAMESSGYYWSGKKRPYTPRSYDFFGCKNPNAKKVSTPNGIFNTIKEASESHKIGPDALRQRIKKYPKEYFYL